jgi:hypothetical protein
MGGYSKTERHFHPGIIDVALLQSLNGAKAKHDQLVMLATHGPDAPVDGRKGEVSI